MLLVSVSIQNSCGTLFEKARQLILLLLGFVAEAE